MTKTMKKIEVAYICDKSYALTTLVSLRSLKKYRAPNIYYLVHMIVAGFEQKKEKDIIHIFQKEAVEHEIDIVIHQIQHEQNDAIFTHRYVSKAALIKFRLPHILENVNRILYLDGDTLIRSGLEDICEADIEQCYAAVVEDMSVSMSEHRRELGLIHYFNSGVMYLNLEKMRTDHVEKMLIQQKKKEEQQLYMDQDAFNVVLGQNVIYLHPRFNLIYDMYRKYTLYEIASFIIYLSIRWMNWNSRRVFCIWLVIENHGKNRNQSSWLNGYLILKVLRNLLFAKRHIIINSLRLKYSYKKKLMKGRMNSKIWRRGYWILQIRRRIKSINSRRKR